MGAIYFITMKYRYYLKIEDEYLFLMGSDFSHTHEEVLLEDLSYNSLAVDRVRDWLKRAPCKVVYKYWLNSIALILSRGGSILRVSGATNIELVKSYFSISYIIKGQETCVIGEFYHTPIQSPEEMFVVFCEESERWLIQGTVDSLQKGGALIYSKSGKNYRMTYFNKGYRRFIGENTLTTCLQSYVRSHID